MSAPPSRTAARGGHVALAGRVLLFAGGLGLAAWLVCSAGLERVAETMRGAGAWLPIVVALEACIVVTDFAAIRTLLGGDAGIPAVAWGRATMLAYASSIVLPAGRAAGEAVRATTIAPFVGIGRAAAACSRLQGCVLVANAVFSILAASVVAARGVSSTLSLALYGNAVLCSVGATALFAVVRSDRLARWIRTRFKRFAESHGQGGAEIPRSAVISATLLCMAGRAIQTAQYGIVVLAVGGTATPGIALTAQGTHLVGATVGDLVPNQMGATEGAYRVFAGALGMAGDPARALSMAFVVRLAQLALSGVCFVVAMTLIRQPRSAEAR